MLVEVKVKTVREIDGKTRKKTETYLVEKDFFAEAEFQVTQLLHQDAQVSDFNILSLRVSPIAEICDQFQGESTFVATLKDIFHDDEGNEKQLKYKVLLWADTLTDALSNTRQLAREGYEMQIESLKEVEYEYLTEEEQ